MLVRMERKRQSPAPLVMYCMKRKLVRSLWKTAWSFLKKLEVPYDPTIPLWGYLSEEKPVQRTGTAMFVAGLFTIAKIRKDLSIHFCRQDMAWFYVL